MDYFIHLSIHFVLYIFLVSGFCILYNYTGLINLSYVSIFAIGAYTFALTSLHFNFNFIAATFIVICIAIILGFFLSFFTNRFSGDYFALVTLGFAMIVDVLLKNCNTITNGPIGISNIVKPNLIFFKISNMYGFLSLFIVYTFVILIFLKILKRIYGTSILLALKEDEQLLNALGKNTFNIKSIVIIISSIIAALAGQLYATYISFIDPYSFTLNMLLMIILISSLVSEIAKVYQIIIAVFAVMLIPEIIKIFRLPQEHIGPLQQIIYAITMLCIIILKAKKKVLQ